MSDINHEILEEIAECAHIRIKIANCGNAKAPETKTD